MEGLWCGLADGLDALRAQGAEATRVLLIGGAAASPAVRQIGAEVLGMLIGDRLQCVESRWGD